MKEIYRNLTEYYVLKKVSDVIKDYNYTTPSFQRLLDKDRVDEIYSSVKDSLEKGINHIISGCIVICKICSRNSSPCFYIIDGNHRLTAFQKIYTELKEDLEIMCNVIEVKDEEQAEVVFKRVNTSKSIPEMPKSVSLSIPNEVIKTLEKRYTNFSTSREPKRPNISRDILIEKIGKIVEKVNQKVKDNSKNVLTHEYIVEKLEQHNTELRTKNWVYFKKGKDSSDRIKELLLKVNKNQGMLIGMEKDWVWIFKLFGVSEEMQSDEDENKEKKNEEKVEEKVEEKKPKRHKIPMVVRNAVIQKYLKDDKSVCFCCKHILRECDIELGHIIPFSKGGNATVDNLVPICSSCNKSVGNRNLATYIDELGINEEIQEY
jgi:hypothetical protein